MVDEDKKTKAKAPAKKAEAKTDVKKAAAKAPAVKKAVEKKSASGKTLTVTQVGSPIGRKDYQKANLVGLGLNKLHRSRVLEDTPSVRGMIAKVKHLVKVDEAA